MSAGLTASWYASTSALIAAALTCAACARPASVPPLPPLGPNAPIELAVPGATALRPSVATQPPLVAVAFGTRDTRGALVYLATSVDNGATFSPPRPATDYAAGAAEYDDIRLTFVDVEAGDAGRPRLRLEWQGRNGLAASRLLAPWARRPIEPTSRPTQRRASAIASCESDGEVRLVAGQAGADPVSVNHGLTDQACRSRDAAAVLDARQWVHAVWSGGQPGGHRLFYAASSDRRWFGGAQTIDSGGQPAHVQVTTDPNDTVVAVWDHEVDGQRQVSLRQVLPAHHGPATLLPVTRLSDQRGGERAVVAGINGGVIAAWEVPAAGSIVIRRVGLDAICETTPPTTGDTVPAAAR